VPARAVRAVLVDDHAPVREGTQLILEGARSIAIVAAAGTGAEARR
jgi:DNA-binding NarL/FixJ family response regulator